MKTTKIIIMITTITMFSVISSGTIIPEQKLVPEEIKEAVQVGAEAPSEEVIQKTTKTLRMGMTVLVPTMAIPGLVKVPQNEDWQP